MGKKVLKEQHSWANFNYIDILSIVDPSNTNKFLSLMVKHLKSELDSRNKRYESERKYILDEISSTTRLSKNVLEEYDSNTLESLNKVIEIFGRDNISLLNEFNEHLNCNRIEKNDISQYNSFDDIREVVKSASFKQAQKELKNSTHIVHQDDHWLMIKPLTFESSKKYGASTKWCTTMENNSQYFYNYSRSGSLIYIFNTVTNVKTAAHIRIDEERGTYENPIKLYNEKDVETDSFVLQLPKHVMEILMGEYRNHVTNENFIKEKYPKIYESEWKNGDHEKVSELTEMDEIPIPDMPEPERDLPEINLALTDREIDGGYGVGLRDLGTIDRSITFNGSINLNDEAIESLQKQLFPREEGVEEIIKKVNEYTKTGKLKNMWRRLFSPKVVIVGVPVGSMAREQMDLLGGKLNDLTNTHYRFVVIWVYESRDITFTTL